MNISLYNFVMSKEKPDPGNEDNSEYFNPKDLEDLMELFARQSSRVSDEKKIRNSLWGLELLLDEKEIVPQTPYKYLIRTVRRKISELRAETFSAKDVTKSEPKDDIGKEFKEIAEEDMIKSQRFLSYLEATERMLVWLNRSVDFDQELTVDDIMNNLKRKIKKFDDDLNQDEEMRRRGY